MIGSRKPYDTRARLPRSVRTSRPSPLRVEELERRELLSGTPYGVGPTVTPTTTGPEAEEHIAVDPGNAANLVAAVSDFSLRGGFNTTKYAFSFTNGAAGSWTQRFVPLVNGSPATGDGQVWQANSDPVVAIDKLGNVYLADLYFNSSNNANGVYVSVASLASGVNFTVASTFTVASDLDPATNVSEDKEWIAVDNSTSASSGNVYVSWSRFIGNSDAIVFSRSVDQGQTWSAPVQISPASQNGAVQGSQVAVGPGGEVYVVYEVFFIGGKRQQFLAKSVDGGQTFSAAHAISPVFNELSFSSTYRKNSFAALAVGPNGNVYVAYADQPDKTAGAQVEFIRSVDGGSTFSAPLVINDSSTGQQFMPALAADSAGVLHASWFDTRNSPRGNSRYDIFAAYSADNGLSFSTNARVTGSLVNVGTASFIGDYAGIAAAAGSAHPVWTNGARLQTAALTLPAGVRAPGAGTSPYSPGWDEPIDAPPLAGLSASSLVAAGNEGLALGLADEEGMTGVAALVLSPRGRSFSPTRAVVPTPNGSVRQPLSAWRIDRFFSTADPDNRKGSLTGSEHHVPASSSVPWTGDLGIVAVLLNEETTLLSTMV